MQLLDTDIAKFKKLYKEKFNIDLDNHNARHKLSLLARQMELVYRPISKRQLKELVAKEAMQRDALALAELTYDIYQEEKAKSNKKP